ncbi:hypothetical protein RRG08_036540 [Elysia crispata]|uniref:Uncharacterized protein n=1 Tax=Elysia crispata TaxID=231223 RepID=A0AAE1CNW9_9GAST|nr:hypothetical protein RRG08_036540 [Elysia crispata]
MDLEYVFIYERERKVSRPIIRKTRCTKYKDTVCGTLCGRQNSVEAQVMPRPAGVFACETNPYYSRLARQATERLNLNLKPAG